jgi:hypothetical protein
MKIKRLNKINYLALVIIFFMFTNMTLFNYYFNQVGLRPWKQFLGFLLLFLYSSYNLNNLNKNKVINNETILFSLITLLVIVNLSFIPKSDLSPFYVIYKYISFGILFSVILLVRNLIHPQKKN